MEDKLIEKLEQINESIKNLERRVDERLEIIETQQKESISLLKALEHSDEVNRAEHNIMQYDIAEIKGEVKGVREDLTTVEPYISH